MLLIKISGYSFQLFRVLILLRINTTALYQVMQQYCHHAIAQLLVNKLLLFFKLANARWRRTVVATDSNQKPFACHLFLVRRNDPASSQTSVIRHQP